MYKKIIAVLLAVCLLVSLGITSAFASSSTPTMVYNGWELPDIETVWTDKETYPYAILEANSDGLYFSLILTDVPYTYMGLDSKSRAVFKVTEDGNIKLFIYLIDESVAVAFDKPMYQYVEIASNSIFVGDEYEHADPLIWSSYDILDEDGAIYFAASESVGPNTPNDSVTSITVTPSTASITSGESVQFSAVVNGSGNYDNSVQWLIVNSASGQGVEISDAGLLTTPDDFVGDVQVRCMSSQTVSVYTDVTVTVEAAPATITGISITNQDLSPWYLCSGDITRFWVTVEGTGDFSTEYTVGTTGAPDGVSLTYSEANGAYILIHEPASDWEGSYEIWAASVSDPAVKTSVTVINEPATDDGSGDSSGDTGDSGSDDTGTGDTTNDEAHSTIIEWLQKIWQAIKDGFDSALTKLEELLGLSSGSPSENALKAASSDVVDTVTDLFYGEDDTTDTDGTDSSSSGSGGSLKVNSDNIGEVKDVMGQVGSMMDTGYSIGDMFEAMQDDSITGWFTAEVAADLDTTGYVSAVDDDDPFNMWVYFQQFAILNSMKGG